MIIDIKIIDIKVTLLKLLNMLAITIFTIYASILRLMSDNKTDAQIILGNCIIKVIDGTNLITSNCNISTPFNNLII